MECTGFSIGGSGDSEGVCLIGKRTLSTDKVLNLTAPFTKYEDNMNGYNRAIALAELIETCKAEVYAYLFEGKHQPDAQLSLFPEDEQTQYVGIENADAVDKNYTMTVRVGNGEETPITMQKMKDATKALKKKNKSAQPTTAEDF